jgi:hypothetical protein
MKVVEYAEACPKVSRVSGRLTKRPYFRSLYGISVRIAQGLDASVPVLLSESGVRMEDRN